VYQVDLRSIADSNGDGNGDIAGLVARQAHISGRPLRGRDPGSRLRADNLGWLAESPELSVPLRVLVGGSDALDAWARSCRAFSDAGDVGGEEVDAWRSRLPRARS
jgi:hypothetical protein